ncbi:MAG TPA: lipid-A-disaccharide synthase [Myxococcales bacterium]|nr:lipid-A-disaccharide synthase [Myxococcales bacterium]
MSDELLVVALEASADLHGAAVLRQLRALRPGLRAFGAGGPLLRAEGCETLVRAEDLSVMGIAEVLPALPRILRALRTLRRAAVERKPRAALLIDSPDFNLRLARKLRALRVPVAYFIGPSVWAWRSYRVRQIARDVARMLVILPFEEDFYARRGVRAVYVGNPLVDSLPAHAGGATPMGVRSGTEMQAGSAIASPTSAGVRGAKRRALGLDATAPVVALLPGSRKQEIRRIWPAMLDAARTMRAHVPELQLVVPVAPTVSREWMRTDVPVVFIEGRAPEVLAAADVAVIASGTATLEAALAQVPSVVVYRVSWLSWLVGRLLVHVPFISLVNLIAGRRVVPELLQGDCTGERIARSAETLLHSAADRESQLEGMRAVRNSLAPVGAAGGAARRVAESVLELLGDEH